MPTTPKAGQLLDGAQRVILEVQDDGGKNATQRLHQALRNKIPPHYRFVRFDRKRVGNVTLRYHLKAFRRKSRAKAKPPTLPSFRPVVPKSINLKGTARPLQAELFGLEGESLGTANDITSRTVISSHRRWFIRKFSATLAEHKGTKLRFEQGAEKNEVILKGWLFTPQPKGINRPRHPVRQVEAKKPKQKASVCPKAAMKKEVRKKKRLEARRKREGKAKKKAPPKIKQAVHRPPTSTKEAKGNPLTFSWQILFCLCKGEEIRFVVADQVTTHNTKRVNLKAAAKPALSQQGWNPGAVLTYLPVVAEHNLLLVLLKPGVKAVQTCLDLADLCSELKSKDPKLVTALKPIVERLYATAQKKLMHRKKLRQKAQRRP